jgi:hypothetical protein
MICKGAFANHSSHLLYVLRWINIIPPGPAGPPCLRGRAGPVFRALPFFRLLNPWEKVGPVNLREKLQKIKRKTIYKNSCLVFRPRWDVRALLPW